MHALNLAKYWQHPNTTFEVQARNAPALDDILESPDVVERWIKVTVEQASDQGILVQEAGAGGSKNNQNENPNDQPVRNTVQRL